MARRYRVLVVEDEALIGLEIANAIHDKGMAVVGPAHSVSEALALTQQDQVDAAVLDIHLGKEQSISVADALAEQSVPVVFVSGYSQDRVPARHRRHPFISKPYHTRELMQALTSVLRGRGSDRNG